MANHSDQELYNLSDDFQKSIGMRVFRAALGDENGRVDVPGYNGVLVYVRYYTATGFSQPFEVAWRAGSMTKTPGTGVIVEYDYDKALAIKRADYPAMAAQGTNPTINNPADPNNSYFIQQMRLVTFASHPISSAANSMLVAVQSGTVIDLSNDELILFAGEQIDLETYIPGGAGEWCLACIFWTDTNTTEVITSTPVSNPDLLGIADINECFVGRTAGSLPIWAWRLYNGQTGIAAGAPANGGDDFMDLRPLFFMLQSGGSGMTSFTVAGDSGTPQTISDGDTLTIAGGTGLSSVAGATDTLTVNLDNTAVTPNSYTYTSLTVDQQGRITAASNGTAPAPANATYITQVPESGLSAEQALSALATGLMKVTTTSGVVSSINDSAGLAGVISDETGSGALVFGTSPTIATPTVSGENVTDFEDFAEASAPSTPAANHARQWAEDRNGFTVFKTVDSTGNEIILGLTRFEIMRAAATVTAGQAVRFNGTIDATDKLGKANLAKADSVTSMPCMGIAMDGAATNSPFRVVTEGFLVMDTSGFSANDKLYVSAATGGALTSTAPTFPDIITHIATVITSSATGLVWIHPNDTILNVSIQNKIASASIHFGSSAATAIIHWFTSTTNDSQLQWAATGNRTVVIPDISGNVVLSEGATILNDAGADVDIRFESDTDANNFFSDGGNNNIGIGTGTPGADAKLDVVSTTKGGRPAPVMTAAEVAAISSPAQGLLAYESDTEHLDLYDGQRFRLAGVAGWCPYAVQMGASVVGPSLAVNQSLPANGGSIAIPIWIPSHMLLEQVSVRNLDTASAHTWGWGLYEQYLNNGNSGENTLTRVAASTADETWTASVASTRTIAAASAPVYLAAGVYWIVIQNRHATNAFAFASTAASNVLWGNTGQTKTTTNPNGATLDFVTATWTKVLAIYGVILQGRVFGQTTNF